MRTTRGPFLTVDSYLERREEVAREVGSLPSWVEWTPYYYVYRYYNDDAPIGHRLHYIGMTKEFVQRDEFHQRKSLWRVALPITRIEIVEYPDKHDATIAEALAIHYEIPCQNGEHNRHWSSNHPTGGLDPACDPDFARTGKTEADRKREAMAKFGERLAAS